MLAVFPGRSRGLVGPQPHARATGPLLNRNERLVMIEPGIAPGESLPDKILADVATVYGHMTNDATVLIVARDMIFTPFPNAFSERARFAAFPKGCPNSGASMPSRRTLT